MKKNNPNIYCETCKKWHKRGSHTDMTTSGNVDAVIGLMMRTFRLRA